MRPGRDIGLLAEFLPNAEVGPVERAGLMLDLARLLERRLRKGDSVRTPQRPGRIPEVSLRSHAIEFRQDPLLPHCDIFAVTGDTGYDLARILNPPFLD